MSHRARVTGRASVVVGVLGLCLVLTVPAWAQMSFAFTGGSSGAAYSVNVGASWTVDPGGTTFASGDYVKWHISGQPVGGDYYFATQSAGGSRTSAQRFTCLTRGTVWVDGEVWNAGVVVAGTENSTRVECVPVGSEVEATHPTHDAGTVAVTVPTPVPVSVSGTVTTTGGGGIADDGYFANAVYLGLGLLVFLLAIRTIHGFAKRG